MNRREGRLVLRGGTIVDQEDLRRADIAVAGGVIVALGEVAAEDGDHLVDCGFACQDADGTERGVLVVFTDHVFTRKPEPGDRPDDAFPGCSRTPRGYVCPTRYRMSFQLPKLI